MTNTNQQLKNIILFWVLLVFVSCVTENDKYKCYLDATGIVSKVSTYTKFFGGADDVAVTFDVREYSIVFNEGEFQSKDIYPDTTLQVGDSVLIFKDWKGHRFCSASSNSNTAIGAYVESKKENQILPVVFFVVLFGLLYGVIFLFGFLKK